MLMRILAGVVVAVTLLMLGVTTPAAADDIADCVQSAFPDLAIRGCTNLIEARRFEGKNLAIAHFNRGNAYRERGDIDRAIADYGNAIELDPDDARAYNNRGNAYRARGEYDSAIADLDRGIQIDPDNGAAYRIRGIAYSAKGDHERAIADFDKAIELDPDDANAYNNRGVAYSAKGDHDRAIADHDKSIELNPGYAFGYRSRGIAYRAKGDHDRAIVNFDKAIELNPDDPIDYFNRGSAHFYNGDFDAATPDLRRSAQSGAVYGVLWLFVAQSLAGQDAATELAANSESLRPKEWPYPVIDLYLGNQSADAIFAKAGNTNERCEAYFYIGEWHLMQGQQSEAMQHLRSAVETCPKDFIEYAGAVAELGRINLAGAATAGPYQDGQAAYDRADFATALRLWRALADQGDADAQLELGGMYARGVGVPQDDAKAVKWFRLAADQGAALAQYNLGLHYRTGLGVALDEAEAVRWYRLAAEQGNGEAQYNLGVMYTQGRGVPKDFVLAHMWFNLAAGPTLGLRAVRNRVYVASLMTPEQIAEAERLAREWMEAHKS